MILKGNWLTREIRKYFHFRFVKSLIISRAFDKTKVPNFTRHNLFTHASVCEFLPEVALVSVVYMRITSCIFREKAACQVYVPLPTNNLRVAEGCSLESSRKRTFKDQIWQFYCSNTSQI